MFESSPLGKSPTGNVVGKFGVLASGGRIAYELPLCLLGTVSKFLLFLVSICDPLNCNV